MKIAHYLPCPVMLKGGWRSTTESEPPEAVVWTQTLLTQLCENCTGLLAKYLTKAYENWHEMIEKTIPI